MKCCMGSEKILSSGQYLSSNFSKTPSRTRYPALGRPGARASYSRLFNISVCQMCSGVGSIMWGPRERERERERRRGREGLSAVCFIAVLLKRTIHLWRGFSKRQHRGRENRAAGNLRNRGGSLQETDLPLSHSLAAATPI